MAMTINFNFMFILLMAINSISPGGHTMDSTHHV